MVFKKMQVGDVVVLRSDEDAQLLRAIEGHEIANWETGNWQIPDMTVSVKKLPEGKYEYSWCEKLQCPKWWSTRTLPRVSPIPEGYEPAFEGEEIKVGWMFDGPSGWKIYDTVPAVAKVSSGHYCIIKPKQSASQAATATPMVKNQFVQIDSQEKLIAFIKSNPKIVSKAIAYPHGANGQLKSGTFKKPFYVQWYVCDYICQWERPRESHLTEYFIPVSSDKPVVTTVEHQDGATTTTVSVGGIGSKFEKNGREYEVTDETEVANSNGLRKIEIKAVSRPVYGQSPMKPTMDALDAVAEASKILDDRPSMFPSFKDLMAQDPLRFIETRWTPEFRRQYEKHRGDRKQEIASIVQSVVEKLS